MTETEKAAALAEAFSGTVTPYSQIRTTLMPEAGQRDLMVGKLTPNFDKNGLYVIEGEYPIIAPDPNPQFPYKRTLYIGTKKDPQAKLPDTRKNSPGLRFLKAIAEVNELPSGDMSDAALCASITGKSFGCRIEETEYTDNQGNKKKGSDFGRNVTKVGVIPARLDRQPASGAVGGNGAAAPVAAFGTE